MGLTLAPPEVWACNDGPQPIHESTNARTITIPLKVGWVFMMKAMTKPHFVKRNQCRAPQALPHRSPHSSSKTTATQAPLRLPCFHLLTTPRAFLRVPRTAAIFTRLRPFASSCTAFSTHRPPWLPVSHPKNGHRQPATSGRGGGGGGGSTPELKRVSTLGDEPQAHASSCVGGHGKWKSGACIRQDAACSTRDACAPSRLSPANRSRPFEAAVNA